MRLVVLTGNDPASPGGIERFTQTLVPLLQGRLGDRVGCSLRLDRLRTERLGNCPPL